MGSPPVSDGERFDGFLIIPRHPVFGAVAELGGITLECVQVVQRIGSVEPACVDNAHESIPVMGPVFSFVEQRVVPVTDCRF